METLACGTFHFYRVVEPGRPGIAAMILIRDIDAADHRHFMIADNGFGVHSSPHTRQTDAFNGSETPEFDARSAEIALPPAGKRLAAVSVYDQVNDNAPPGGGR